MSELIDDFNDILQATVDQTAAVNDLETTYRGKVQEIDNKVESAVTDTEQAIIDMNATAQPHIDDLKTLVASENLHMAGEVDMETRREMVNHMFPSSGVVYGGMSYGDIYSSRLGLWTHTGHSSGYNDTALHLGRLSSYPHDRKSPTGHAVINMHGFLVHLAGKSGYIGNDGAGVSWPTPPGELGTRVYNRATGESIDYLYEADPKYPDEEQPLGSTPTAQGITFNEAVYRAHDKYQKNANGRHGIGSGTDIDTGWRWGPGHAVFDPDTNRWSISDIGGTDGAAHITLPNLKAGEYVKVSCKVISKTNITSSAGARFRSNSPSYLASKSSDYTGMDKFIGDVPEGEYVEAVYQCLAENPTNHIGILVSLTDSTMVVEDLKVELCDENGVPLMEVVTEREDVYGVEGFLRPINPGDFVYPYGAVDSSHTTMSGIATRTDDSRPDSFFANYKGHKRPYHGRGVVFHDQTLANQAKLCSDPKHNIYRMANGQVVQFCYRPKVYIGYGNGPWGGIDQSTTFMEFDAKTTPRPFIQGYGDEDDSELLSSNRWLNSSHNSGIKPVAVQNKDYLYHAYRHSSSLNKAYNYEAYFLILATIPTLNQGVYSNKNRLGTGEFQIKDQYTYLDWRDIENIIGREPRPEEHFLLTDGEATGFVGRHSNSGSKASGRSSRPDGKGHDRLYSGGYNSPVIRHPYFGALKSDTIEAEEEVRREVLSNRYPCMERAPRSHIIDVGDAKITRYGTNGIRTSEAYNPEIYEALGKYTGRYHSSVWGTITGGASGSHMLDLGRTYIFGTSEGVEYAFKISDGGTGTDVVGLYAVEGYPSIESLPETDNIAVLEDCTIIICYEGRYHDLYSTMNPRLLGPEVAGEFETSVVYGNPRDLLKISRYKEGWDGYWGGFTDTVGNVTLPRMTNQIIGEAMTDDLGTSWTEPNDGNPTVIYNEVSITDEIQGKVWEVNFLANASVFKFASGLPVSNGLGSVGKMQFITGINISLGSLMLDYFTNKVPTAWTSPYYQSSYLYDVTILPNGQVYTNSGLNHDPVKYAASSKAPVLKCVMLGALNSNRLTLQARTQELISDVTDPITECVADSDSITTVKGKLYRFSGFPDDVFNGKVFIADTSGTNLGNASTMFSGWTIDSETGKILNLTNGATGFNGLRLFDKSYYWGDLNYLQTANHAARDYDNNGNRVAVCSSELVLPYGTTTL